MPVRAYNEIYKEHAVKNISGMFDYAVRILKEDPDKFVKKFIDGGVAERIESGDPEYLQMSATELYRTVTGKEGIGYNSLMTSREYSAGELFSEYQWRTGKTFFEIFIVFPASEIIAFEGGESEFDSEMERRIRTRRTNLEYFRTGAGLSQSELASLSGVDIRSIQMYEQRRNDISKAQYNILSALAKVLSCTVADLTDARNFRLPDGADEDSAKDMFIKQVMAELTRRQNSVVYKTPAEGRREARKYFYAYGYLNAFPVKKIRYEGGKYFVDGPVFNRHWKNYWNGVISSQKERESVRAEKREAVLALSPVTEENEAVTPYYLALAVLCAIDEIEK